LSTGLRRLRRGDLTAFALLVILVVVLPMLYVSAERVVYSSDYSGFQDAAVSTALELRSRLAGGVRAMLGLGFLVWRSTGWDYSLLPAVLPAPIVLALHAGRLTYIVTCAVLYLLPLVLLLGANAALLTPEKKRAAFWIGVLTAVALPALWIPTLRGYPDAGAAALVAFAIIVFVRDTEFRLRRTPITIGVCLAVAILFRRHYAYPAISLMAVIATCGLVAAVERWRLAQPRPTSAGVLPREISGGIWTGAWLAGALLLIGPMFVYRALRTNYTELYASYMKPPTIMAAWFGQHFGWIAWMLAALGYFVAWRFHTLTVRRLVLVLGALVLTLGLWTFRVRQIGEHYALHIVPLIALGHFALVWTVAQRARRGLPRSLFFVAAGLYALVNGVRGLAPSHYVPSQLAGTRWLADSTPPLRWSDYGEMMRLVSDLRRVAGRGEPIYVAASGELRSSSLRSADRMLDDQFRDGVTAGDLTWGSRLFIPHTPHIDSRDGNPTSALLTAKYVLVATPVQYHLPPDQQRIVRAAVEAFTDGWAMARDFELLPGGYTLGHGASVKVYRRTRPSNEAAALEMFARFRAALGPKYQRPPLIYLGSRTDVRVGGSRSGDRAASVPLASDTVALVLADTVSRGGHLRAIVRTAGSGCETVRLTAMTLSGESLVPNVATPTAPQMGAGLIDLPLSGAGSAVLIHVWREAAEQAGQSCQMTLSDVRVDVPTLPQPG
jgi:hypothetical protein